MYKIKILILLISLSSLSACQIISPIFVDYNGVRRDVAQWINQQQLMSMQQKRSLAQLSRAQQKIERYPEYDQTQRLAVTRENQIALHCVRLHVTEHKIQQLQQKIYAGETQTILNRYEQLSPQIKLDPTSIRCD
ncbi:MULTISPECIES: hypothetical protein [Acinetobacter]|jgi:hypothetical protein|uniref:hypothetical protein n=1 Tax=Acinetobacter TaxID=469 RepID=UPI0001BBA8A7|nr:MULTISPECIES: hypothetical protein [Acinetobacter]EEY90581.1 hypothetical protein HMPREF0017_01000 [Acinetobacter lwoffii SH145]ENX28794.1 hypothetical protein F891_01068 [Acinetobacter sp. CIP 101966]MCO8094639.1 hypothetical protein [Acinetobacter lwoffii]MDP1317352.1 hypothetical protein [Acinetobacter lwoffii]QJB48069.1 hypothetical protein HGD77_04605 [Acinetobacter sp. NEB149]